MGSLGEGDANNMGLNSLCATTGMACPSFCHYFEQNTSSLSDKITADMIIDINLTSKFATVYGGHLVFANLLLKTT